MLQGVTDFGPPRTRVGRERERERTKEIDVVMNNAGSSAPSTCLSRKRSAARKVPK